MNDVLIVGAGPAGCVAAIVLSRAGVRVRLVDRARFPRPKLCGDTVNPGTLAILGRLGLNAVPEERGLRVDGMRLTGENGAVVEGRYPRGCHGRAVLRRDLDWALLEAAIAAGAAFEDQLTVRAGLFDGKAIAGVRASRHGSACELPARVTVAADGRHSTLAFALNLARHPPRPRRWAIGAYFENVADLSSFGEMHVRRGRYLGVAPLPGGVANVCLVVPSRAGDADLHDPGALLDREIARDPLLAPRFATARPCAPPVTLGPLAVDVDDRGVDGLILAGDAAGFIDPITGDGLRFAVRGGELAAGAALDALAHGWSGVHVRLAERRRQEFGAKWRFNRAVRRLVASPRAVSAAALTARFAPGLFRAAIAYAGDVGVKNPTFGHLVN